MINNQSTMARLHNCIYGCILCALCLWLAGCAGSFGEEELKNSAPAFRDPKMSVQEALDAVFIGKSTQADVAAALGKAAVIQFESGFEVWVYRVRASEIAVKKSEVVVLFAPSGIVRKVRIRVPPAV